MPRHLGNWWGIGGDGRNAFCEAKDAAKDGTERFRGNGHQRRLFRVIAANKKLKRRTESLRVEAVPVKLSYTIGPETLPFRYSMLKSSPVAVSLVAA